MYAQKNFNPKAEDLQQIKQIVRFRNSVQKSQLIEPLKQNGNIKIESQGENITIQEFVEQSLSNHQSSLKICPHLLNYILHGMNQVYIFYGDEEERLQTFLGNPNDPGMLMVVMVYLMQQKYKMLHGQLEIKISFMESNGNQFLDLLTDQKLAVKHIQLCTWIKINEYLEYLKAIKLALYSNKKRDFKVSKFDDDKQTKDSSIFISRMMIKVKGKVSQIMLIDVPMQKKKQKNRNGWQSFLHSFNRQNSKLQQNQLTQFLIQKLSKGKLTFVYSMTLAQQKVQLNISKLKQLQTFINSKPLTKIKFKQPQKYHLQNDGMQNLIQSVIDIVKAIKYDSIEHLQNTLSNIRNWKTSTLLRIKQVGQIIIKLLDNKMKIGLYNYTCYSERRQLIGKGVKSENLKQFYNAKTYQSLYREVEIKTQESRNNIKQLLKNNLQLKESFYNLRKSATFNIENKQLQPILKNIMKYIHHYFHNQKIILRETLPYWICFSMKKIQIQDKIAQFEKTIKKLQSHVDSSIDIKAHSFKQDGIISSNNLLIKVNRFIQPKSQCILPKLMFKKIVQTENVPEKKFGIKLSDFLLKLPKG